MGSGEPVPNTPSEPKTGSKVTPDPMFKSLSSHWTREPLFGYAGSGPFFGEQLISTESGFTMGFCQWAEMGANLGFGV